MKLILFDIDGTLIRTAGAGRRSMERAFEAVWEIEDSFRGIMMMGRTDPSILDEALENHHIESKQGEKARFREIYFDILRQEIVRPRKGKRLCAGIPELLEGLSGKNGFFLGLLTGNWRTSAFIKLRYFEIDRYFITGAFADDAYKREELVPVAQERFAEKTGTGIEPGNIYVIGDTPMDIQSGKPHGVRTVGVATGFHDREALEEAEPDFVFEDFGDTEKAMAIFN